MKAIKITEFTAVDKHNNLHQYLWVHADKPLNKLKLESKTTFNGKPVRQTLEFDDICPFESRLLRDMSICLDLGVILEDLPKDLIYMCEELDRTFSLRKMIYAGRHFDKYNSCYDWDAIEDIYTEGSKPWLKKGTVFNDLEEGWR